MRAREQLRTEKLEKNGGMRVGGTIHDLEKNAKMPKNKYNHSLIYFLSQLLRSLVQR